MSIQSELLKKYGEILAEQFRQSVPKVTGKTAASIVAVAGDDFIEIYGSKYIFALEFGRKPTSSGASAGTPTLFDAIKEWATAKGIIADESKDSMSIVWAITKSIHEKGTLLFQSGVPSGVLSKVIDTINLDQLLFDFAAYKMDQVVDDVQKEFDRLSVDRA
jgi:hypothetical protein